MHPARLLLSSTHHYQQAESPYSVLRVSFRYYRHLLPLRLTGGCRSLLEENRRILAKKPQDTRLLSGKGHGLS